MTQYESPLATAVKGAAAGLAGTAVLNVAMQRVPSLLEQAGILPAQPTPKPAEPPPAKRAQEVAGGVFGQQLDPGSKHAAAQSIRWGYGALWGAIYGIVQSSIHLPRFLHGTIFGLLVLGASWTAVPAMRLTPPPTEQPLAENALHLAFHLLYGWTTALTFHLLSSDD